jgi:hypothetical protein
MNFRVGNTVGSHMKNYKYIYVCSLSIACGMLMCLGVSLRRQPNFSDLLLFSFVAFLILVLVDGVLSTGSFKNRN